MRLALILAALLFALPAHAFTDVQGQTVVTSCPAPTCVLTGSGTSTTVDNVPDTSIFWTVYCNGQGTIGPEVSCSQVGRFQLYQGGVKVIDDNTATFQLSRTSACPYAVTITSGSGTAFSVFLSNPHIDEFNRLSFDTQFVASVGIGSGSGGDDDPPIVHH